ncbi:20535_t:CDS:2 [Gigaspora margarita]|uniref:20535_t:CDS:1 n=1 Tax=Gigaspora margarita TaxID=4874 RepID=A0ABN7V2G8_GIGMA|nr:20535_t:CDS:2 [Gigaspora margarita]
MVNKTGNKSNKKIRLRSISKTEKEWFDLMKSKENEPNNPEPQVYHFLDLDIEVPWPVPFPKNKKHHEFAEIKFKNYEVGMTKERAQEILNAIDNGEFLIRVKFIRNNSVYEDKSQTKIAFKIIDKYEPICKSKKASRKYIRGGPNVIVTKKMKPGFWIGIDEKFLVSEVSEQSEVEKLDSNAVVYGLYRIQKPDINRLLSMKDGALNCVAE